MRTERNIRLHSQGKGDRPWFLERRNGLARGNFFRLLADNRFASCAILNGAQLCLDAMLGFGTNPMDLFMWRDDDSRLGSAQEA